MFPTEELSTPTVTLFLYHHVIAHKLFQQLVGHLPFQILGIALKHKQPGVTNKTLGNFLLIR